MAKASSAKGRRLHAQAQARRRAALVVVPDTCDVAVLGGGASGLAAALGAAWACPRATVAVLDAADQLGRPILATGNGRCNLSNQDLDPARYNRPEFVRQVMGPRPEAQVAAFCERLGLATEAEDGRLYPRSRCATSVQGVLLTALAAAGVIAAPLRAVTRVRGHGVPAGAGGGPDRACCEAAGPDGAGCEAAGPDGAHIAVTYEERFREAPDGWARRTLRARTVVLATGGGAALAPSLGLPVTPLRPVLCPVAVDGTFCERMTGHRARCRASLERSGRQVWSGEGEVLFRPGMLSGILAFDLSRFAQPGNQVVLDLAPGWGAEELASWLAAAPFATGRGPHVLDGLLDPALGAELVALCGAASEGGAAWAQVLAAQVKGLSFSVTGLAQQEGAQVTRGGVRTDAVSPATLEAERLPGVFVCGEALDVDGACGGYNLAFAWLSGLKAGAAAAARIGKPFSGKPFSPARG